MHSILIIGQSNMAGRGKISDVEPVDNDKIHVLRNGRWQKLFRPVNPDRSSSGINLSETFADAYAKEHDVNVGIIPCADSGSALYQWKEGELLFDHAVCQAKLAQRTSEIVAVLWHQGESECSGGGHKIYEVEFTKIMNAFRRELGLEHVPFILGAIGDFVANNKQFKFLEENYRAVNEQIENVAKHNPMTGFASAEGLNSIGDNLHFDAPSLYEFGRRYYKEFKRFEDSIILSSDKTIREDIERTEMEKA